MASIGRGTKGKRGIGTGKKSECVSPSKPGSSGIPVKGGSGNGGSKGSKMPPKGKMPRNMGGKY